MLIHSNIEIFMFVFISLFIFHFKQMLSCSRTFHIHFHLIQRSNASGVDQM